MHLWFLFLFFFFLLLHFRRGSLVSCLLDDTRHLHRTKPRSILGEAKGGPRNARDGKEIAKWSMLQAYYTVAARVSNPRETTTSL